MRTASTCTHDHERFVAAFLDRVRRDRDLPANAYKVASIIAEHVNRRTRVAWPGRVRIAELAALSEATVKRMIRQLCDLGHLEVEPGQGRGRSSRYRLLVDGAEKGSAQAAEKGSNRAEKGSIRARKGVSTDPQPSEEEYLGDANASPQVWERENARAAAEPQPAPEPTQGSAVASLDAERNFRELRATWHRGHVADDTPRAIAIQRATYFRALREGADPRDIVEAARNWVDAADAPRFLPQLSKWLESRGWEVPPPAKASSRGRGAPRGRSERRGRKPNLAKLALAEGGYVETADGRMIFGGAQ
jgi:DNA-binding MarR family transcriptional regulator